MFVLDLKREISEGKKDVHFPDLVLTREQVSEIISLLERYQVNFSNPQVEEELERRDELSRYSKWFQAMNFILHAKAGAFPIPITDLPPECLKRLAFVCH